MAEEFDKDINPDEYKEHYSEEKLQDKVKGNFKKVGANILYQVAQLYYVAQSPNCPTKIKMTIMGALGYFIMPLDLIPDIAPAVGYTDDAAAIAAALVMAQIYIDDDVKAKAKKKIKDIFGEKVASKLD